MTDLTLARAVDARDAALLAQQEKADELWFAAQEEAAASLRFNDLLDALYELSEDEQARALRKAAKGDKTRLLAWIYQRCLLDKTQAMVRQAKLAWEAEDADDCS